MAHKVRPDLVAPEELRSRLELLLPKLAEHHVCKVEVFADRRPGEPPFWVCFLFRHGRRHSLGTTELRDLPLDDQVPDLLRQLQAFDLPSKTNRGVRTMLWLAADFKLPEFILDPEYWPGNIVTATVPADRLDELQLLPGVHSFATHE